MAKWVVDVYSHISVWGYLQSIKSNIREIIRYIDDTTLEKSNDKKKDKQESTSTIPEEVQEFVNLTITEHMGKAYSEWKLNQDKEAVSEIDKKYQHNIHRCKYQPNRSYNNSKWQFYQKSQHNSSSYFVPTGHKVILSYLPDMTISF